MFDANRELAWSVNNDELGGIFNDVCGLQVLKSGNILVSTCAHHRPKPHDLKASTILVYDSTIDLPTRTSIVLELGT